MVQKADKSLFIFPSTTVLFTHLPTNNRYLRYWPETFLYIMPFLDLTFDLVSRIFNPPRSEFLADA